MTVAHWPAQNCVEQPIGHAQRWMCMPGCVCVCGVASVRACHHAIRRFVWMCDICSVARGCVGWLKRWMSLFWNESADAYSISARLWNIRRKKKTNTHTHTHAHTKIYLAVVAFVVCYFDYVIFRFSSESLHHPLIQNRISFPVGS